MPELDTDVLEVVCRLIDNRQDLLSVSLASSVLRGMAIRHLLRSHTTCLKNRKAIRAFRTFIFSRKADFALHIRSLVIPANAWLQVPWETDLSEDIMDIIDCAENLVTLDLSLPSSYKLSPRLSSTLATVGTLRHLSLTEAPLPWEDCWVHHALKAIRSPLVTLRVRGRPERYTAFILSTVASHFSQSLSHFSTSSTLTTLEVGRIPMHDFFLQLPRFLSVRSLILTTPLTREPDLAALLHLFPSLDGTLSLHMDRDAGYRCTHRPEMLAEIQDHNRRAQATSGWTKLDRLDCDWKAVRLLALQCPVRRLTTDAFDSAYLGRVRPRHFVFDSIHIPYYEHISPYRTDENAVADSSSITHAVVIVTCTTKRYEDTKRFTSHHYDMRWEAMLKHTVGTLAVFQNLAHARLVFHCARAPSSDDATYVNYADLDRLVRQMRAASVSEPEPEPESESESDFPPREVLAACPALRTCVVTVAGRDETEPDVASRGWLRTRAWRAVGAPEGQGRAGERDGDQGKGEGRRVRILERLSDCEARTVIEDEDLGLPEAWEEKLDVCRT